MFSTKCYSSSTPPYESIILVEPPLIDRHVFQANIKDRERQTAMLTKAVAAQRSAWNNREAAFDYFVKRAPWKTWDIRVVVIQIVGIFLAYLDLCLPVTRITVFARWTLNIRWNQLPRSATSTTKRVVLPILSRPSTLLSRSKKSAQPSQSISSMAKRTASCAL